MLHFRRRRTSGADRLAGCSPRLSRRDERAKRRVPCLQPESPMPPFVFLNEVQTMSCLSMPEVVAACEGVLLDQGHQRARLSSPAAMFLEADQANPTRFKVKGGYLPGLDICGFRVVGDLGPDGALGERHFCLLARPCQRGAPRARRADGASPDADRRMRASRVTPSRGADDARCGSHRRRPHRAMLRGRLSRRISWLR